jgi:hypothetical protein
MSIDYRDYLNRFERRDLGPEHFDHSGHLLMAWTHLRYYDLQEASRRVCNGVRDLAGAFGAPEKYSHTLTIAFMYLIAERMQGRASQDFEAFLAENKDLVQDAQSLILRHYSRDRLDSAEARRDWVEPDLEPFAHTG